MKWISIKDRLPKLGQRVLVGWDHAFWLKNRDPAVLEVAVFRSDDTDPWIWCDSLNEDYMGWDVDERPTHWMLLPEPPSGTKAPQDKKEGR